MAEIDEEVLHICLAGTRVSNDLSLIQTPKPKHLVTLVESIHLLSLSPILPGTDLVVMDCSGNRERGLQLVPWLKSHFPQLVVVLFNGDLTQEQIASAFKEGAKDYFSDTYDVKLLAESVNALIAHRNRIE
jgi:DNA-binding NarL/FixJ family response regulator